MSNIVFPALSPAIAHKRTPLFNTILSRSSSANRVAIKAQRFPRWNFQLEFLALNSDGVTHIGSYDDYTTLLGFTLQMAGRWDTFLYTAKDFNSVVHQPLAILTDDNGIHYSPIRYNIGGFLDLVTDLNGAEKVYNNGSLMTNGVDYTLQTGASSSSWSEPGLIVKWAIESPPLSLSNITWSGSFYYRCAFVGENMNDTAPPTFERFDFTHWHHPLVEFESEFDNA